MELKMDKYGLFVDSYRFSDECELLTGYFLEMHKNDNESLNDKHLEIIRDLFDSYLKGSEYKNSLESISIMQNRGISITFTSQLEKDEAFKLYKNLCKYFDVFGSKYMDEKGYEYDQNYVNDVRKSREILKTFYDDVICNSLYEYKIVK